MGQEIAHRNEGFGYEPVPISRKALKQYNQFQEAALLQRARFHFQEQVALEDREEIIENTHKLMRKMACESAETSMVISAATQGDPQTELTMRGNLDRVNRLAGTIIENYVLDR